MSIVGIRGGMFALYACFLAWCFNRRRPLTENEVGEYLSCMQAVDPHAGDRTAWLDEPSTRGSSELLVRMTGSMPIAS